MLGIGGGGDVVGALAVARLCESLGTPFVLGGVAWERFAIDPHPGPRAMAEIRGGRPLGDAAVLAGPETATPEGVPFAEARMAAHLGTETVLIDVSGGAAGAAAGIASAAERAGLRPARRRRRRRRRARPRRRARAGEPAVRRGDGRGRACESPAGSSRAGGDRAGLRRRADRRGGARAGRRAGAGGRLAGRLGGDAADRRRARRRHGAGAHRGEPAGRPLRARGGGRRLHPRRPAPRRAGSRGGAGLRLRPASPRPPRRFPWPTRWPMPTASRRAAPPWPPSASTPSWTTSAVAGRGARRAGAPLSEPAHPPRR